MVQPLSLCRVTPMWLARLDRSARGADFRVRFRVPPNVHATRSPHCPAQEVGCHPDLLIDSDAVHDAGVCGLVFDKRLPARP